MFGLGPGESEPVPGGSVGAALGDLLVDAALLVRTLVQLGPGQVAVVAWRHA